MLRLIFSVLFSALLLLPIYGYSSPVFINELHYDNAGADEFEAVELAGVAGTDLSGWYLQFYNGLDGSVYDTMTLSGDVPDEGEGYGAKTFYKKGIQNGSPDGLALIDDKDSVVSFLSYEGEFLAVDGVAAGLRSVDMGVFETSSTAKGLSLQLSGLGRIYEDFVWTLDASSFSAINKFQDFRAANELPVPGVLLLMLPFIYLGARSISH